MMEIDAEEPRAIGSPEELVRLRILADRIQYLHDELIRTEEELAATQKALLAADDLVVAFEAKAGNASQSPTIGAVEPPAFLVIDTQSLALCGDESPAPLKIHRD
jgi:hypothetical protein